MLSVRVAGREEVQGGGGEAEDLLRHLRLPSVTHLQRKTQHMRRVTPSLQQQQQQYNSSSK